MNLKKAELLLYGLLAGVIVCGALYGASGQGVLAVLTFVLLAAEMAVFFLYIRCPHCGKHLGRDRGGFCPHCGKKLREDP